MKTIYSKSSDGMIQESAVWMKTDVRRLEIQQRMPPLFENAEPRKTCLVCGSELSKAQVYPHRGVDYLCCTTCEHFQTSKIPPTDVINRFIEEVGYGDLYTKPNKTDYITRRKRIYDPKLHWILDVLRENGWSNLQLQGSHWTDLGAGAGYFLHAVQEFGVTRISGIETHTGLVENGNAMLGDDVITQSAVSLSDVVRNSEADILTAFFVLEHVEDAKAFWDSMAERPAGSIFAFAVPCFSLATLMESAVSDVPARNLDNLVHTQVFTDQSIKYGLEMANFEMIGQWIFGQDAFDLTRMITSALEDKLGAEMENVISEMLGKLIDPLQAAIDQSSIADARHIIARKRS